MRRLAALAILAAVAACGGGGEPTKAPPAVASLTLSVGDTSLPINATLQLTATATDVNGQPVTDRPLRWTSGNTVVATVDSVSGLLTAKAPGTARITATVGNRTSGFGLLVVAPVSRVRVAAPSPNVGTGGSAQLTLALEDVQGNPLSARAVAWTTSDASRATVDANGVVTGVGAGTVVITAESEGVRGSITLNVIQVGQPRITSIAPGTLVVNETFTITGSDFGNSATEVSVIVDGVPAQIVDATLEQIRFRLGAQNCRANGPVSVQVRGLGGTITTTHPLRIAVARALQVGVPLVLQGAANVQCNELPAGGKYVAMAANVSPTPSARAQVAMRGLTSAGAAARFAAAPASVAASVGPTRAAAQQLARSRDLQGHLAMFETARQLRSMLGSPRPHLRRAGVARRASADRTGAGAASSASAASAPVPLTVNDTTTIRFRTNRNQCATSVPLKARVAYVGTRSVILEAADAPLAGQMDADYRVLGEDFDRSIYPMLVANFGDPLLVDNETDKNGRIIMLFSKSVNDQGDNLLGWVNACDVYPPTIDPVVAGSNQAEIFYARVPTAGGTGINARETWLRYMRSTVAHEAKHIASLIFRLTADVPEAQFRFEESWLEEGTAQIASELFARTVYPTPPVFRGNAGFDNTLRCELANGGCPTRLPVLMLDMFSFLNSYYPNIATSSFYNSSDPQGTFYGSAWLFARWAADQYASEEPGFFRTLIQQATTSGLANVSARTGATPEDLVTNFLLALYADDLPGFTPPSGARYTIPTWNTRDVWAGLNQLVPGFFTQRFPLRVTAAPTGAFSIPTTELIGGGAVYAEVSAAASGQQLIELTGGSQAIPDGSPVRLVILRTQ